MPAFIGFTLCLTMPFAFVGLVTIDSVEPWIRTLTPAFALPCWVTLMVIRCCRPTNSDWGVTVRAVQ